MTLKQVSIPSFEENLVPKMKYIPNAMKFGTQDRLSSLIINMIGAIALSHPPFFIDDSGADFHPD